MLAKAKIWPFLLGSIALSIISIVIAASLWTDKLWMLCIPILVAGCAVALCSVAIKRSTRKLWPILCLIFISMPVLFMTIAAAYLYGFVFKHIGSGEYHFSQSGYNMLATIPPSYYAEFDTLKGIVRISQNKLLLNSNEDKLSAKIATPYVRITHGEPAKAALSDKTLESIDATIVKSIEQSGRMISEQKRYNNGDFSIQRMVTTDNSGVRIVSGMINYPNRQTNDLIYIILPASTSNAAGVALFDEIAGSIRQ